MLQFELWDINIPYAYLWGGSLVFAIAFSLIYWTKLLQPVHSLVKSIHGM